MFVSFIHCISFITFNSNISTIIFIFQRHYHFPISFNI
eukprot:UN06146